MNYTKDHCSCCGKELKIRVAKGDKAPEKIICKACSQSHNPTYQIVIMNLGDALKIAKGSKRVRRCEHRDKNWHVVNRYAPTHQEAGQRKRIYGSD